MFLVIGVIGLLHFHKGILPFHVAKFPFQKIQYVHAILKKNSTLGERVGALGRQGVIQAKISMPKFKSSEIYAGN